MNYVSLYVYYSFFPIRATCVSLIMFTFCLGVYLAVPGVVNLEVKDF